MAKIATVEIVKHDGELYVKEARKAKVGEKFIITDNSWPSNYDIGEVFTAEHSEPATCGTIAGVYTHELANRRKQNCIGFVKDGKYAVLTPLIGATVTVNGKKYKVTEDEEPIARDLVIAVEEDWAEDFKVGDVFSLDKDIYGELIFIDNDGDERSAEDKYQYGYIYTLKQPTSDSRPELTLDEKITAAKAKLAELEAEKAREEAEAKRQAAELEAKQAEEKRWSAIGRKVGEYKKGDVVKITKYLGGNIVGHIGEVSYASTFSRSLRVLGEQDSKMKEFIASVDYVELVTPVEQRFDTK